METQTPRPLAKSCRPDRRRIQRLPKGIKGTRQLRARKHGSGEVDESGETAAAGEEDADIAGSREGGAADGAERDEMLFRR